MCARVCTSVFPFFPGQGNHVLYIDVIKFKAHRARFSNLLLRLRQRVKTFIHFLVPSVITSRQDVDGGLVISNEIMKQGWHSDMFLSPSVRRR